MIKIISAILLGFGAVAVIWWLPPQVFRLVVFTAIFLSLFEYARMAFSDKLEKFTAIAMGTFVGFALIFFPENDLLKLPLLIFAVFITSLFFMWRSTHMEGVAERLALSIYALIYISVPLSFWSYLREGELGREMVMMAIVPSCLCDTFAYAIGKKFGKKKLAPMVSPKKTKEGFLGALLGSLIGAFIIWKLMLNSLPFWHVIIIAFAVWILSPMGDLIESLIKRSFGVKDSGTIIPGHGGVMDRLDALTFTGAFMYVYMKYILAL